jgi:aspartyl/glutamyl-tRNA(Asn/Gln) amidotransferase C subunit
MSAISLREEEIAPLMKRMEEILSYAQRVTQVATAIEEPSTKNVNVLRNDVVVPQNTQKILAQMPERAGDYLVVPMILDN